VQSETIQKLEHSYAKSATAAARNRLYASLLIREGRTSTAKLITAMANSDEIQARRILMYLRGKLGEINEYLNDLGEVKQDIGHREYPQLSRLLTADGEHKAAEAIDQFGQVAQNHADLLARNRRAPAEPSMDVYVCQVCGYIAEDQPPAKCPVCNAIQEKFKSDG
jgi:rubrerythrin